MTDLLKEWHSIFGIADPEVIVRAPGRVNIIGEHTDYNNGFVLPGAMDLSIYVLAARSELNLHHWVAASFEDALLFSSEDASNPNHPQWSVYVKGAMQYYAPELGALKLLIGGDLPVGAGISSSSALVCGVLKALQQITGGTESAEELAKVAYNVEREVIGLQGGIMDQFAIMMSKADHVMLLDCRSLDYQFIDASLPGCRWLLINTRVKHQLIDSDYNQRAAECAEAVQLLMQKYPHVSSLRDVTRAQLDAAQLSTVLYARVRFVIDENERVLQMVAALNHHDPTKAGELLAESHAGLRDEYEVSCPELDLVADIANGFDGVYGARMMGGGFGGCVICLVKADAVDALFENVSSTYESIFQIAPSLILFELGDGVRAVQPKNYLTEVTP
jgi:galactokinase